MATFLNFFKKDDNAFIVEIFIVALPLALLKIYNDSYFYSFLFLIISIALFLIGKRQISRKLKLLFFLFSAFVFLHLIVFPQIYSLLLTNNKDSFQINTIVVKNEKENAIKDLETDYNKNSTAINKNIVEAILSQTSPFPDTTIEFLLSDNILILDSFYLTKSDTADNSHEHPMPNLDCIAVHNKSGLLLTKFFEDRVPLKKSKKIKDYLLELRANFETLNSSFILKKSDLVDEKQLWSYERVLPYSINIFNSDNIKPITRLASIINFLHSFIVWTLLISIIGALLFELLSLSPKK